MKLPLSPRLLACAGFVRPGDRVADVGCDHGYLGIHLLETGVASSIIAADINPMPLQSAMHNARKFGVKERMTFYLSDGLRNVPHDFDSLVCAGMGGDTMIAILSAAPWLKNSRYRLILQCQSKTFLLRRYLSDNGWHIAEEAVLRDGKFLYTVMEVRYAPEVPRLTVGQAWFPPAILKNPGQASVEYYHYILEGLRIATAHRQEPEMEKALWELAALVDTADILKETKP